MHRHTNTPVPARAAPCLLAVGAAAIAALLSAGHVQAATQTLTVTTPTDPLPGACPATVLNPCTLRQAITVANGDTNDVIVLPAATYATTQGELPELAAPMSITGHSARDTIIDGGGTHRIMGATGNAGTRTISISNVTFTNGNSMTASGGGFATPNTVPGTVNNLNFTNVAFVANNGDVGGMYNGSSGHSVFTDVLISGNTTPGTGTNFAAGVRNDGTLTMVNVTITGNIAGTGGGAAGALENDGPLTMTNVTIAANTGDGAPAPGAGGIYLAGGSASAVNTIVSNNTNRNCTNATIKSNGHNIELGTSCGFTGTGDQNADPKLDSLKNNGGQTNTLALLGGSPAIDKGSNAACPSADQRGLPRVTPQDPVCDIGAFEVQVPAPPVPNTGVPSAAPWPLAAVITVSGLVVLAALVWRRRSPSSNLR